MGTTSNANIFLSQYLTFSSPYIETLLFSGVHLRSMDVSGLPNLKLLSCGANLLTTLDLSHNHLLTSVFLNRQYPNGGNVVYTGNSDYPYEMDFSELVGYANVSNVKNVSAYYARRPETLGGAFIGIINTEYSGGKLKLEEYPYSITYQYQTGAPIDPLMHVELQIFPHIEQENLSDIQRGKNYSQTLSHTAIVPPPGSWSVWDPALSEDTVKWSIVQGKLPSGLTLNSSTGEISGITS